MKFTPRPGILDIEPYIPGASKGGSGKVIKLSSNENPLGPSPEAVKAYKDTAEKIFRYPDGGSVELREALAKKHNMDAGRIVCGTGSDELISLLCRAYCGEGDEVLYTEHGFLMYPIAALSAGATPVKAAEPERKTDLNALLSAVTDKTKMVFIANPNNPTGALVQKDALLAFHAKLRSDIILVIDSAYAEYVEEENFTDGRDMVDQFDNVVMLRTFSKIYGLGGMRVGWSYSSKEIADILNRIRGIFNLSIATQAAALAALFDDEYIEQSFRNNSEQKKWITSRLEDMGIHVYPGEGNFILFTLGTKEKAIACLNFMKERGILLRGMMAYGLPDCLRMTIGLPEDMQAVDEAMKEFFA
ncbi:MAG: histidinol-phosphate transaminase [Micavibrio aeruginosavorus]|uniref:Histidinol-phosphate aminotransferase n=1 Tax=Micavibrio aeruginosavorus TaxID=349221 RepID=A0A2W5HCE5_9BACT|nr:MAG: histidinol-phosphate transaminase [Micavibrio aeruginosavorus]